MAERASIQRGPACARAVFTPHQTPATLSCLGHGHDHGHGVSDGGGGGGGADDKTRLGCAGFPDTSRVLLVMKTGVSEAFAKIPNHIMTNLGCVPDFLVFSDMAQELAGHPVHDSLDAVLPEVQRGNKDFDLYFRQRTCLIDQAACNRHHDVSRQGWNLDKYKNMHIAENAFAMRPGRDWYLFVDADTYVAWPTLVEWLRQLDPDELHYIGSVAYVGSVPFAHGGSGYLVSWATMRSLFGGRTGVANRWDERTSRSCCGDFVFSLALKNETNIDVRNAVSRPPPGGVARADADADASPQWPTINGEKPHTLPYSDKEWCQPIATMHHAAAEEVSGLHAFERGRNFSSPLRIKDLFHRFVRPHLMARRDDWDNLSDHVFYLNKSAYHYSDYERGKAKEGDLSALELLAHQSFDDCRRACYSLDDCLQFRFYHGICSTSHSIKHGHPTKEEPDRHWQYLSGWNMKRINDWVAAREDCGAVEFPFKDAWLGLGAWQ